MDDGGVCRVMEVIAYEMKYGKVYVEQSTIACIPFETQCFEQYKSVYNECFYDMRKALEIEPYHYLNDYEQVREKVNDIYLFFKNGEIIGSVACYENEIDDLIVNKKFQQKGYGKQLLLWGMQQIRKKNNDPITLHVAEWNQNALMLYKKIGFEVVSSERVR